MSQLMYYDDATSTWKPVVVGAQGITGPQGLQGITGSAGTSAYAVYQPALSYGLTGTASISIPAGTYLYETPSSVPTTFTMNGQSKSGTFGTITTATTSTTINTLSSAGYNSLTVDRQYNGMAFDGTYYVAPYNEAGVKRSTDAVNWTTIPLSSVVSYGSGGQIVYGNGIFLIGWDYNGPNVATYSTDGGSTWQAINTAYLGTSFGNREGKRRMIFNGTNFVILNNNGNFLTTSDCVNFTVSSYSQNSNNSYSCNLSFVNGKYFTWCWGDGRMYSGATVNTINASSPVYTNNTPNAYTYASRVVYSGGLYWYAGMSYQDSNCYVYSSSDGITWTTSIVIDFQDSNTAYYNPMFVNDGSSLFLQSGYDYGTGNAWISQNSGTTWSSISKATPRNMYWFQKVNSIWFGYFPNPADSTSYDNLIEANSIFPQQKPTYVKLTSTYTAS